MPKKIFDEKKYQNTKGRLKKAGIIVIIISLIIGALLIIPPIVNLNRSSNESKVLIDNDEVSIIPKDTEAPMTQAEYDAAVKAIETEYAAKLQAEITAIREEYAA